MTAVAVSRLRVRASADRAARARSRVEDALRLAPAAAERLLVVRRLALGRIAVDARPERWQARAADALAEQAARAVHAAQPGASEAGAVWFRSAHEARALLLRELAAGRRPSAWFWRLAVPDWDAAPLGAWLPRWIAAAERDPEAAVALARAVVEAAEAGLLPAILDAVAAQLAATAPPPWRAPPSSWIPPPDPRTADVEAAADEPAPEMAIRLARRSLLALPAAARLAIRVAFVAHRQAPVVARWLARAVVLAAAPEMASSPAAIEAAADALVLESLGEPQRPAAQREPPRPQARDGVSAGRATPQAPGLPEPHAQRQPPPTGEASAEPPLQATPQGIEASSAAPEIGESTSAYAGLLLLVRPLWRLGIAEWLDERPAALVDGFARRLLCEVGRRMGADADDPVLEALAVGHEGDWTEDESIGADWTDAITAWRVGLDRWLRRTARVKLADVVKRRGGVLKAGDRLDVRFALAAADIRLRRNALDLDPLWTPWLGLSIRYHFQDQPLQ